MIEERASGLEAALVGAHPPPAVHQQHDTLIPLVLELPDDRLADAQGGLPVDVAQRIADAVLGQLFEVSSLAATLVGLDAEFLQTLVAGEPGIAAHLGEVGKHTTGYRVAQALEQLAQAEAGADVEIGRPEGYIAALRRLHLVPDLEQPSARNRKFQRQPFRVQRRVDVIIEGTGPVMAAAGLQLEQDGALHPDSESIRQTTREGRTGGGPCLASQAIVDAADAQ